MWKYSTEFFDQLPLAATIDNHIFCVHGGLTPEIVDIDDIRMIDRIQEIPHEGAMCGLLWSDPDENVDLFKNSPRGAGMLFGKRAVVEFGNKNNVELICRAHQLVMEG